MKHRTSAGPTLSPKQLNGDSHMSLPTIAVTMGDPAGIGPEICLQAVKNVDVLARCVPVIFGDAAILADVAHLLHADFSETVLSIDEWNASPRVVEPTIVDFGMPLDDLVPGRVSKQTGAASFRFIESAIEAAMAGTVDAVVTGPIHKEAIHAAGVPYPGHTEIFADKTRSEDICMMLTSSELTCSLVTTHVGYDEVPGLLSIDRIVEVIELSHDALRTMQGKEPRLTVCGLNPHGGEQGLFGNREEERIIAPAVKIAQQKGIHVVGPISPDTAFVPERRVNTDGYICMYHDQGLIPLKAIAFDYAVNVTLGIPIIRTSVDHGTACDIAWKGIAKITSMTRAIELASRLASSTPALMK